jgi:HD superfamily phosphohydrolase
MILGDTEVNEVLRRIDPSFPEQVAAVIAKSYPKEIVVSLVSSQLDADRMDYLLRDAYYTGVNYGTFDMERILRMMRPYKGHVVVKDSGMHAVEDYLMSRYQMHWQVYFHPVTRSAEILLDKIFMRAKALYEDRYPFRFMVKPIQALFDQKLSVNDYFYLDEALMQTVFMYWMEEEDGVLADLCARFIHRRLFKHVPIEKEDEALAEELRLWMNRRGWKSEYYVEIDFPLDLPYDVYRPGELDEKLPILLLDERKQLNEISTRSEIVRSISGIRRGQNQLYYPAEIVALDDMPETLRRLLDADR